MRKKRIFVGVMLMLCGALCIWLFLSHMFGYNDWYLKSHPEVETYVGINVVSMFADFSFFTYVTLLLFSLWCFLFAFLHNFCKAERQATRKNFKEKLSLKKTLIRVSFNFVLFQKAFDNFGLCFFF